MNKKQKDPEQTIKKAINITGVFLENLVATNLSDDTRFKMRREEPYSAHTSESFEGTTDIFAISKARKDTILCLLIECKKANPEQKYWVFDKRKTNPKVHYPFEYYDVNKNDNNYEKNVFFPSLGYKGADFFEKAIQSFEFNEKSGKLSRNQGERPYFAMKQANEGLSYYADVQNVNNIFELAGIEEGKWLNILYVPIVVTTANLKILEYDVEKISWETGEVDIDELETKHWIHFEFPLPYSLVIRTKTGLGPNKRPTFIVSSTHFTEFLDGLFKDCENYII